MIYDQILLKIMFRFIRRLVVGWAVMFLVHAAFLFPRANAKLDSPSSMMHSYRLNYGYRSYCKLQLSDATNGEIYADNGIDAFGPDSDFAFQLMLAPKNITTCNGVDWNDYNITDNSSWYSGAEGLFNVGLLVDVTKPLKNCTIDEIIYNIMRLQIPALTYVVFSQVYEDQFDTLLDKSLMDMLTNTYAPTDYGVGTTGTKHSQPPSVVPTDINSDDNNVYVINRLPTVVFLPTLDLEHVVSRIKRSASNGTSPYYVSGGFTYWNFLVVLSSLYYSTSNPPNFWSGQDEQSNDTTPIVVIVSIVGVAFVLIMAGVLYVHAKKRSNQLVTPRPSSTQATTPNRIRPPTTVPTNNNATSKNEIDALTYKQFEALPRIHYDRSQTYSIRKNLCSPYDISNENGTCFATIAENRIDESHEQGMQSPLSYVSSNTSINVSDKNLHHSGLGDEMCSICFEEFCNNELIIMLPECKHLYHIKCLGLWILDRKSDFCPVCKVTAIKRETSTRRQQDDISSGDNILSPENNHTYHNLTSDATNDQFLTSSRIPMLDAATTTTTTTTNNNNNSNDSSGNYMQSDQNYDPSPVTSIPDGASYDPSPSTSIPDGTSASATY